MDDKLKEKLALFRFSLIAPLLNNTFSEPSAKAYLETICAKVYDVPYFGKREYSPATVKNWLLLYRKHGFEGLYPLDRNDKGQSRSLSEQVKQYIKDVKLFYQQRSAKSIYHELIAKGLISSGSISLSTVQRFINGRCVDTIYPANKVDNAKASRNSNKKPIDFSPFNV